MDRSAASSQIEAKTPPQFRSRGHVPGTAARRQASSDGPAQATASSLIAAAFEAEHGYSKAQATRLFQRIAEHSSSPTGKLRGELIPDSSWKRAGKVLGPQASQTTARLSHVLSLAERVWGNQDDATEWLNSPHLELQGATPYSLLKTEAGGRAVEALLSALDFGFPV